MNQFNQFSYIFNGVRHTDASEGYMESLGMNEEQMNSVINQREFEGAQVTNVRQKLYTEKSDPLYIEWQYELVRGNPNADEYKQRWMDAVAEVKASVPKI